MLSSAPDSHLRHQGWRTHRQTWQHLVCNLRILHQTYELLIVLRDGSPGVELGTSSSSFSWGYKAPDLIETRYRERGKALFTYSGHIEDEIYLFAVVDRRKRAPYKSLFITKIDFTRVLIACCRTTSTKYHGGYIFSYPKSHGNSIYTAISYGKNILLDLVHSSIQPERFITLLTGVKAYKQLYLIHQTKRMVQDASPLFVTKRVAMSSFPENNSFNVPPLNQHFPLLR